MTTPVPTSPAYYDRHGVTVHAGDCLDILRTLPDNSVDAVITDPPYGLAEHKPTTIAQAVAAWTTGDREHVPDQRGFMGRRWDGFVPPPAVWDECLRVLKPGGYLACFSAPRTVDLMGLSIRMAGFEIRDGLQWIFGSGFPKSRNVSADLDALPPCRCGISEVSLQRVSRVAAGYREHVTTSTNEASRVTGRWPTNAVLVHHAGCGPDEQPGPCVDGCPVAELDAQSGPLTSGYMRPAVDRAVRQGAAYGEFSARTETATYGDSGGASRFFPVFRWEAKAPTSERPQVAGVAHPTVKPLGLMRWVVRLLCPPGGTIIDPFAGSGTTGQAARAEGMRALLIEREDAYLPLIVARLDARDRTPAPTTPAGRSDGEPLDLLDLLDGEAAS